MYKVKVKFSCNAGKTEEVVELEIFEGSITEEQQIDIAFNAWVENNEDVHWEKISCYQ